MKKKIHPYHDSSYIQDVRSGKRNNIKKMLPDFDTIKDKKNESRIRQKVLSGSNNTEEQQLGIKLSECGKTPCYSPACPVCARQFRRWCFAEFRNLSKKYEDVVMMTVVYYCEKIPDEKLMLFDPLRLKDTLRQQLKRSGFEHPVVGSLELDYHVESRHWIPHFHLMVLGEEPPTEEFRKRHFNSFIHDAQRTSKKDRPIRVDKLNNEAKQISYLYKSYWSRLEAYGPVGERRTKKYRLKKEQLRLSLYFQDTFEFSDFLFLFKSRRYSSRLKPTTVREN